MGFELETLFKGAAPTGTRLALRLEPSVAGAGKLRKAAEQPRARKFANSDGSGGAPWMNTVRKLYESDEQGTVHVELPVGAPHRRVEIVLVWQEIDEARTPPEALDKKRAEIEALAGALSDDPMARPVQPLVETRLPIE